MAHTHAVQRREREREREKGARGSPGARTEGRIPAAARKIWRKKNNGGDTREGKVPKSRLARGEGAKVPLPTPRPRITVPLASYSGRERDDERPDRGCSWRMCVCIRGRLVPMRLQHAEAILRARATLVRDDDDCFFSLSRLSLSLSRSLSLSTRSLELTSCFSIASARARKHTDRKRTTTGPLLEVCTRTNT